MNLIWVCPQFCTIVLFKPRIWIPQQADRAFILLQPHHLLIANLHHGRSPLHKRRLQYKIHTYVHGSNLTKNHCIQYPIHYQEQWEANRLVLNKSLPEFGELTERDSKAATSDEKAPAACSSLSISSWVHIGACGGELTKSPGEKINIYNSFYSWEAISYCLQFDLEPTYCPN